MILIFQQIQDFFSLHEQRSSYVLLALMFIAIVFMGVVSLVVLNNKATKGYLLNQLEEERQELVVDGEETEILIQRARSLTSIEDYAWNMYAPDDVKYVVPVAVVAQQP